MSASKVIGPGRCPWKNVPGLKEPERRDRELGMENSFPKKAAAYFAKDPR